jgi:transcriptional accessory protein Tex/SPT6
MDTTMNNLKYRNGSATYVESLEKKIAELEKQIVAIEKNTDYWADKSAKTLTDEEIYDILWMHFPISDKEKNATMIAVMTDCIKTVLAMAQEK